MQYAVLGRTGLKVSRLGFGAMRLPMKGDKVDRDKATAMFVRAFDLGVNYIDTAVGYCNQDSQSAVGDAIRGRRDGLVISTKNPYYNKADDRPWWKNLDDSLKRLGVDTIDIYNFHGISWKTFETQLAGPGGQLAWMQKARDQGMIRNICFSFHDTGESLIKLAKTGEFDCVTLQYNLIDRSCEEALIACRKAGMGVVVMGPVGGGRLGSSSQMIQKILPQAKSVPEVALRFVLANPNVNVALSGMSELAHVEENARVASKATPLSTVEKRRVADALARYRKLADLYCTGCNYCMPCPVGVDIPGNFGNLNLVRVYDLQFAGKRGYSWSRGKAAMCIACGACMSKCPQHIDIISQLRQSVRTLDDAYGKAVVKIEPTEVVKVSGGRGAAATIACKVQCHNLCDQDLAGQIAFAPAKGIAVASGKAAKPIGPFMRSVSTIQVRIPVVGGKIAPADLGPAVAGREVVATGQVLNVAIATRGKAVSAPAVEAATAHGEPKLIAQTRKAFAITARCSHDAKNLTLKFDVRGRVGGPSKLALRHCDHVALKLDLGNHPGLAGPADRPKQLVMLVGLDRGAGRIEVAQPKLEPAQAAAIRSKVTGGADRRTVTLLIPWKLLQIARPTDGRMGIEVRLFHMRRAGQPPMHLSWGDKGAYLMLM